MAIKDTTESFVIKAKNIHGNKYDYSLVEYISSRKKVKVICKKHGEFEITPDNHLNQKYGCPLCGKDVKRKKLASSRSEFIKKARKIHGNNYKYSLVEYKNMQTPIKIICKKHGMFEITPHNHIYDKRGCGYCQQEKKVTTEEIIKRFKQQHGDKYDYSKVIYKKSDEKVKIICKEHGGFLQTPNSHTAGQRCPKCFGNFSHTLDSFIKKAKEIHRDKYDYSKVKFKTGRDKITIICPKHGEFKQQLINHINSKQGCPICKESKGEKVIRNWLQDNKVVFKTQKKFKECKNKNQLPFDFYLPELNTCIEYDGEQHFKPINRFGGIKKFKQTQQNDLIKEAYCKDNKIKLIRIPYIQIKSVDEVLRTEILQKR